MKYLNACFFASGLALVGYGCWLVYQPACYLVVGMALIALGYPKGMTR